MVVCFCCRRRHRSTRRRRNRKRGAQVEPDGSGTTNQAAMAVDPIGGRLNDVAPLAPERQRTEYAPGPANQARPYIKAQLEPDEALVFPTRGKAALKRVFLGVGWRSKSNAASRRVDVDCCCAPYANGARIDPDTVWFGNLQSAPDANGTGGGQYCTIRHTGDVLSGQQPQPPQPPPQQQQDAAGGSDSAVGSGLSSSNQRHGLVDLERIYVDLENLRDDVDCLAFEGNVFTPGVTFGDLSECYVRLVNADTDQEIMRCTLGGGGGGGGGDGHGEEGGGDGVLDPAGRFSDLASKRVLLLAKLFRGKGRWVAHCAVEGRDEELRKQPGRQTDMVLAPLDKLQDDGGGGGGRGGFDPTTGAPTGAEPIQRGEPRSVRLARQASVRTDKRARRPRQSYLVPALAVGTAAGVAAAVALFALGPPLTLDAMRAPALQGAADFGALSDALLPTDCGCLADFDCCGRNVGDSCGAAVDRTCKCGCCDGTMCGPVDGCADLCSPCEGCDPLCLGLEGCAGATCGGLGEAAFGAGEQCTRACDAASAGCEASACVAAPLEDACDPAHGLEQCGAGCKDGDCAGCGEGLQRLGGCCDKCGTACSANAGEVMDAAADAPVGGVGEGAAGAVGELGKLILSGGDLLASLL